MSRATAWRRPDRATSAQLLDQAAQWSSPEEADAAQSPLEAVVWDMPTMRAAARVACARSRGTSWRVFDAADLAWEGVALHVAQHPDAGFMEAVNAGSQAILREYKADTHHRGWSRTTGAQAPRFATYWVDWLDRRGMFAEPDLDGMALRQVWEALPQKHRSTLLLSASTRNQAEAAHAAGVTRSAFGLRERAARAAFLTLWFDHESAPQPPRTVARTTSDDGYCPAGHDWETNTRWWGGNRPGSRRIRRCITCSRERDRARRAARATTPRETP